MCINIRIFVTTSTLCKILQQIKHLQINIVTQKYTMAEVANNNKPFVLSSAPYDEDPASGLTPLYVDCLQKHFRIIWMKDLKKDSKLGALIKGISINLNKFYIK